MSAFARLEDALRQSPRTWLVTGVAGFVGSHLAEALLGLDQTVVGLDNFATGHQSNIDSVLGAVSPQQASRFRFVRGSITDLDICVEAATGCDHVLHQAALGSVPRSIKDPIASHEANVNGTLHMMLAAHRCGARSMVYASSSSVYGDHPALPKVEREIGMPLSPYAATKRIGEVYAEGLQQSYGLPLTGLRYFNVVGPRQDPHGPYAAVIPRWLFQFASGVRPTIFGDGTTSRDFCPVESVVQANLLAATVDPSPTAEVYNVALGQRTTLNELYYVLRDSMAARGFPVTDWTPQHADFRPGDVKHSLADIAKARAGLGYRPTTALEHALDRTVAWMVAGISQGPNRNK